MINTINLMEAANMYTNAGLDFFKSLAVYDFTVRQCRNMGFEEGTLLDAAMNKVIGKLRELEKVSGIDIAPYIEKEQLKDALDDLLYGKRISSWDEIVF